MSDTHRPDFWAAVDSAFAAAVELPEGARGALLDDICAGRPGVRREVESLLAAHAEAAAFLPSLQNDEPEVTGPTRIGAYLLLERIGVGGMGEVFRADRDDGAFEHKIAIKLLAASLADPLTERRFRAERQILASLRHPNIVTLLDAGVAPDGRAFIAMEYVAGVPITEFCRERRLSLRARLALFRTVCEAVHYSHLHLVVHRDLKPANILVTSDGVAKVLDFGIARLLDEAPAVRGATRDLAALTPNYASPEQVRGLAATAGSDVYALGVLLFELLTGRRPYEAEGRTLDDLIRVVAEEDVPRPSTVAPDAATRPPYELATLKGDLDAVILRALAKAPAERYASAAALADDLSRFEAGLPVAAREPSLGYVVRKLAVRHKAVFASTAVSLAVIVVLLGISLWQTSVARRERRRAERQLADVRQLADTLIFKVHDAVAPLPGSTPVRKMLVAEGLGYLERLSPEAQQDSGLALELARAYGRIGAVQGRPNSPNLGDAAGAVKSYEKAESLLLPLVRQENLAPAVMLEYVDISDSLADTFADMPGHRDDAAAAAERGRAVAEEWYRRHPTLDDARRAVALASFETARTATVERSLPFWMRSRDMYAALLQEKPDDKGRQRSLAILEKDIGGYYEGIGRYDEALRHHQAALALDEPRLRSDSGNRTALFDVAIDLSNLGYAHQVRHELPQAVDLYQRSLRMREELAASDPKDVLAQAKVAFAHRQIAFAFAEWGRTDEAVQHFRDAARLYQKLETDKLDVKRNLAIVLLELARLEQPRRAACADAVRAHQLWTSLAPADRTLGGREADLLPDAARAAAACGG